ncbi:MAG: sodium:proton antiporter, partial [Halopseudomonas yangmingensis]
GWQWPAALRPRRQPVVLRPSLWLKRQLQRPPLPALQPHAASARWRALERRWNQLWRSWPVSLSGWLLLGLLLLGWWL